MAKTSMLQQLFYYLLNENENMEQGRTLSKDDEMDFWKILYLPPKEIILGSFG